MTLLTYNEILTYICDTFDALITPRKIARTNTNIIYLMFKAISKGYEVIHNVCYTVNNKFNPASCSDEDLVSVAELVGTEMMQGSASGLHIIATNKIQATVLLPRGFYNYELDEDTLFTFEVLEDTYIEGEASETFFAFSDKRGSYPVTAQAEIKVTSELITVPTDLLFSCEDNSALLGTADETLVEFRNRILTNTTRQDSISEIRNAIKNKPYIFDAQVYFNNVTDNVTIDGVVIPPYNMAIFYSGAPRNEIADVVASKSIFPTVQTDDSDTVHFISDIFADPTGYPVYLIPFRSQHFSCDIKYSYNSTFVNWSVVQAKIQAHLLSVFRGNQHMDYITESSIFDSIKALELENVDILNVDLKVDDASVPYITIPISRVPYLDSIAFTKEAK